MSAEFSEASDELQNLPEDKQIQFVNQMHIMRSSKVDGGVKTFVNTSFQKLLADERAFEGTCVALVEASIKMLDSDPDFAYEMANKLAHHKAKNVSCALSRKLSLYIEKDNNKGRELTKNMIELGIYSAAATLPDIAAMSEDLKKFAFSIVMDIAQGNTKHDLCGALIGNMHRLADIDTDKTKKMNSHIIKTSPLSFQDAYYIWGHDGHNFPEKHPDIALDLAEKMSTMSRGFIEHMDPNFIFMLRSLEGLANSDAPDAQNRAFTFLETLSNKLDKKYYFDDLLETITRLAHMDPERSFDIIHKKINVAHQKLDKQEWANVVVEGLGVLRDIDPERTEKLDKAIKDSGFDPRLIVSAGIETAHKELEARMQNEDMSMVKVNAALEAFGLEI